MGYVRLERQKVKNKIHRDYTKAYRKFSLRNDTSAEINHQEACIFVVEQNPKSTKIECAKGIWPVLGNAAKYEWVKTCNHIAKSEFFVDEHIIGVDEEIQNVTTGKTSLVTFVEIAKGENARIRAKTFDKHIQGFQEKQEDLYKKANDKDLARRLNMKKKLREKIVG